MLHENQFGFQRGNSILMTLIVLLLNEHQLGFQRVNSTHMALIFIIGQDIGSFRKGERVIVVFLDFSLAFDIVYHSIPRNVRIQYEMPKHLLTNFCHFTFITNCESIYLIYLLLAHCSLVTPCDDKDVSQHGQRFVVWRANVVISNVRENNLGTFPHGDL